MSGLDSLKPPISDDLLLLNTFSAEYCVLPHVPHLAVVERVGVVSVSGVLLVAVEPVIVRFVQQTSGRGGQTLDSVRVLGVLVVSLVLLGLGQQGSVSVGLIIDGKSPSYQANA